MFAAMLLARPHLSLTATVRKPAVGRLCNPVKISIRFLKSLPPVRLSNIPCVRFPLKTPIVLLADDGETEKTFPFTKEKWPLLDGETLKEERIEREEGGVYISGFTLDGPKHKVFEAGYEESEMDLRVEFELAPDGKWYVVDCYTAWYGFDLPADELEQTVRLVAEENAAFKELHP